MHFGKCVGISGTIPQTIAGLTRVDYIDLESTKAYHPQPAPLPIGLLERMRDLVSCELTKARTPPALPSSSPQSLTPPPPGAQATTDALEWNTNHFYCAADVHETFASYPAACVPLQYQICAADYWIAQLAGAAVGALPRARPPRPPRDDRPCAGGVQARCLCSGCWSSAPRRRATTASASARDVL